MKYLYKVNQMGDVLGLYDGTGKLVVKYRYDAWGKVKEIENNNGQTITNAESIGMRNPFRYRSYYYDTDTGWYYLACFHISFSFPFFLYHYTNVPAYRFL